MSLEPFGWAQSSSPAILVDGTWKCQKSWQSWELNSVSLTLRLFWACFPVYEIGMIMWTGVSSILLLTKPCTDLQVQALQD